MNITWDRETTGLLDETAIDYCAVPYKLKDSFKTHCIVVEEHETGKVIAFYDGPTYVLDGREHKETIEGVAYTLKDYMSIEYEHRPKKEFKAYILETKPKRVVAHNQIQFDLLVGKLEDEMDYDLFPETWCGLPVEFTDTLVKAKCLNPDRLGGNSLEALSEKTGVRKVDFRPYIAESERFKHFAADMLYYCIRDVKANTAVDLLLQKEEGDWNWKDAIQLEKEVKFVITMQEHRGFNYDKELASNCIEELDTLMEERRVKIEPILPPKAPTKAFEKTVTPPARQFLKTGGYSEDMKKFVDKHAGKLLGPNADSVLEVELFGSVYSLPIAREPLVKEVPATLNDSTHIKEWLVGMGWMPSEYQEKDLSVKTGKIKKTREEFEESVEKYVAQTLASSFCDDRCEYLETTPEQLRQRLLRTKEGRSCKVLTNPKFTKGQEKEICPNLEAMSEKFPYARDIVDYLTYKHRRNSILGGGLEWDEEEEAEKGFLAYVRADGRISTPADTCGAATSRFKHRVVTNIPRTSSLYGEPMRAQFGVDDTCYQIGYDFDSLEAKEEAHFCWRYDKDKQYCNSLTMEKPNDVHCYAEDTEILTSTGWKLFGDIDCEDKVAQWDNNEISFVKPLGIVWQDYSGKMVSIKNKVTDQLVTPNHRVFTVDPRSGLTTVREARMFVNMTSQFAVPISGVYQKESTSDFVRLLVAVQADGCMAKDCTAIQFTFVKARKYKRLLWLLEANSAEYSVGTHTRKGRVEYRVRIISKGLGEKIHAILGLHKKLPYSLIEEGYGKLIVEESKFWDGTERNSYTSVLDTTCQYTRDFLQACGAVNGYNVYCQTYINKKGSFGSCTIHRCLINEGTHTKTFKASRDVELVDYVGKIGCVSVPSGLVLVRRNGKVCVSGNTLMAKKISSIISKEFSRTPAKSVKYACLPMHTKVLTLRGWKLFSEITEGEAVITYNANTGVCEDDVVFAKHHFTDKELFKYSNKYDEFVCTDDHRWYGWKRAWAKKGEPRSKMFGYFQAKDIKQEHNIILTAPYKGGTASVTPEEASFFGWVLSDGYYRWSSKSERTSSSFGKRREVSATIAQSEDKYWRELEQTLEAVGCIYHKYPIKNNNTNRVYCYKINSEWMRNFLDRHFKERNNKHEVNWVEWVCGLSRESLECFYEAFYLGDGDMKTRSRGEIVTQNEGNILDAVVTAAQLLGKGRVTLNAHSSGNKVCRGIRTQRRKHITCQELQKESLGVNESFCLTTGNGSFIIWQDDFIGITGNCTYGATEKKVAKIIGESLYVGTQVYNAFWEAAMPLKMLKEKLKVYWETIGGKKFILGIDGRKVPTRSQHAILNSLFQSAGVICAKRAMVIHYRKLKAEGYIVDFFKDDWTTRKYCQQLIAYHDEAQLEVSKVLVQFKMFATKEEAQAFKDGQDKVWSDIKDSPKGGVFVAYSRPGELAAEAVKEAGEYYKLNVELTAGYVVGKNWAMCH